MVRAMTDRRAGALIVRLAKIVVAINPDGGYALNELGRRRWNIKEYPVSERAVGRIGIIEDEDKTFSSCGCIDPTKLR